jgi:hypothetical protein
MVLVAIDILYGFGLWSQGLCVLLLYVPQEDLCAVGLM